MAHVATVATHTETTNTNATTLTVATGVSAGHTLIGAIAWESGAGSVPGIASIVDSRSNTWTTTPDVSVNNDNTVSVAIIRARVTTALQAGDTITVTLTAGTFRTRWAVQVDEFDDVNTTPLDQTASATGSGTSLSTGTTATTTQAYELLYAAFGFPAGRGPTVPGGWSSSGSDVETAAGSTDRALQTMWKYTVSTGAQSGALTLGSSGTWVGVIGTYKATSLAPPVARVSQTELQTPPPGVASVARVSQVTMVAPQGAMGVARVAQVRLQAPTEQGQAPYSGLKYASSGALVDSSLSAALNGTV